MISQSEILQDELLILEDPMVRTSFKPVLRKVMQDTSGAWKAIAYLKQTIINIPGADYRIRYDKKVCQM